MSDLKERERISDEQLKEWEQSGQRFFVRFHEGKMLPGNIDCVAELVRELRELRAQLAEAQRRLETFIRSFGVVIDENAKIADWLLPFGEYIDGVRSKRDKLAQELAEAQKSESQSAWRDVCTERDMLDVAYKDTCTERDKFAGVLQEIALASRGIPDQLTTDRRGDCTLSACRCSNHLARAALSELEP